ncbi:MAG: flagellar hook protein FlgE [Gammaproteobacteria bacterium]|nr:flagellar hook protein FlgE [Gammaproteobacteria bacterium]
MSFNIALTGLNAASADLAVTSNNIANANTVGFKESRSQFADFFLSNAYGVTDTAVGGGVRVAKVAQQFTQGAISVTNNSLDLAVSGTGWFTLAKDGAVSYTRSGQFGTDRNGFIVNGSGARLQAYPPVAGGTAFDTASLSDVQLSTSDNPPNATTLLNTGVNLPAEATAPVTTPFSASDPTSYNNTTSVTIYDSLGTAHPANLYFVKSGTTANEWTVHTRIDGTDVGTGTTVTFNADGSLSTPTDGRITLPAYATSTGSSPVTMTIDLSNSTQYGNSFSVNSLTQDGYATGRLSGIEVTQEGIVQARFTNGQATRLGKLAMANFANPQGLQQLGDTSWGETYSSGPVIRGSANTSNFGLIQSGALEGSNVDITKQLVNMIVAQRSFQANAQMISTTDQITQTIINIR